MKYTYPKVIGGYRWNLLKRCLYEVGIEPSGVTDIGDYTYVEFTMALTAEEKTKLDTLMADNPTYPPSNSGAVLKIADLWEKFEQFKASTGVDLRLYYNESVAGSGQIDTIELHSKTALTNTQLNKIKNNYASLIS